MALHLMLAVPCSIPSSPSPSRTRSGCPRRSYHPVHARASDSSGAGGSESGMVDANMLVLRRRIHQLRLRERRTVSGGSHQEQWMEWEKSCFSIYRPDLSLMLTSLETQLLDMRPSYLLSLVSMLMAFLPAASLLFVATLASQIASLCAPAL